MGTCLNREYMIFAYIKTLGNVHKALERKACCVSLAVAVYCLLRGWISTCPGLCVLYGSPTRLQTAHLSQHIELVTSSTSSKWTLTHSF